MSKPITSADLPPHLARFAEAQIAAGRFASVEDVVEAGLEALKAREANDTAQGEATTPTPAPAPFWRAFTAQVHAVPDEVFERLPEDGASEHDHYLYGAPKRHR